MQYVLWYNLTNIYIFTFVKSCDSNVIIVQEKVGFQRVLPILVVWVDLEMLVGVHVLVYF
jgi:hypothetical protein